MIFSLNFHISASLLTAPCPILHTHFFPNRKIKGKLKRKKAKANFSLSRLQGQREGENFLLHLSPRHQGYRWSSSSRRWKPAEFSSFRDHHLPFHICLKLEIHKWQFINYNLCKDSSHLGFDALVIVSFYIIGVIWYSIFSILN